MLLNDTRERAVLALFADGLTLPDVARQLDVDHKELRGALLARGHPVDLWAPGANGPDAVLVAHAEALFERGDVVWSEASLHLGVGRPRLAAALERAGRSDLLEAWRRRRRGTPPYDVQAASLRLAAGERREDVAADFGVSVRVLTYHVAQAGYDLARLRSRGYTPKTELISKAEAGWSLEAIADHYGIRATRVRQALREMGLLRHGPSRQLSGTDDRCRSLQAAAA